MTSVSVGAGQKRDRLFRFVTAAALTYLAAVQVLSVRLESCTADEPLELTAGYSYIKTGDFRLNPEHPPLSKILAALPLLWFRPLLPLDSPAWTTANESAFGAAFFQANRAIADRMLFAARLTSILLSACLGLAIALWTRAVFGIPAAMLAITLYSLDPTVIAYGRYVKNDIAVALFSFLACIAWSAFLKKPGLWRLCAAGLTLGCAFASKFSALFLALVLPLLFLAHRLRNPHPVSWRRGIAALLSIFVLAGCVTAAFYGVPAAAHGVKLGGVDVRVLRDLADRDRPHALARMVARGLPRVHPYLEGLLVYLDHNTIGHVGYLLGKQSMSGWWYYFPVAFAVKTPVSTLALLAIAAVALPRWASRRKWTFTAGFSVLVLAVPAAVYCAFSAASRLDIGIRHLLPLWPFLYVLAAVVLAEVRFRCRAAVLLLLSAGLLAESLSIYPDYLAFFNFLAGGPSHGPAILLDSNIDWGQDAKKLRAWLDTHPVPRLCLDYWGAADLASLGLSGPPLPASGDTRGQSSLDCVGAISVNRLYDLSANPETHAWLRALRPQARVGYSIYVYDLRKRR